MSEAQRYRVIERIAAGGMAEVYRGESAGIEGFRKKVAIKRVLPKLSQNQEFIDMFLDEARLCAYLNHSRCVQVFDIGQGGGSHFIVMEYVDGADLKGVLDHLVVQRQRMSPAVACLISQQVCEGLAYAHDAVDHAGNPLEIVHRDISPHNVLMTRHGEVKLVDFGLARASSHLKDEDEDMVKGKFGYLAPEVTRGKAADRRVDIFAAGVLLWEMLAGRRLFQGETDLETFKLVQAAVVPDIRRLCPEVSPELARVVLQALASNPEDRYQSAHDFSRDLSHVYLRQGEPATYRDLAAMVSSAAAMRARLPAQSPRDRSSILGDVIIDALHEFSSLEDPDPSSRRRDTRTGHAPPGHFIDPSEWALDDALGDFLGDYAAAGTTDEVPELAPLSQRNPRRVAKSRLKPDGPPKVQLPAATRSLTPAAVHRSTKPPLPESTPWWKKWWG